MSAAPNAAGAPADPVAGFPQIPVDNSLGAWLLGVAASLLLNGILIHQMYHYFSLYPKDRLLLKTWVSVVVVLETFISVLILHTAYFYLINMYWNPAYFFISPTVWSLNLLPIPGTIAALISQTFFVRRVWLIAPKFKVVVGAAFILIAGNVVCFTVLSVKMFKAAGILDWLKFSWLASVGSSIQMAGDIILTLVLIYVLRRSRTGVNKTDSMLDVLIAYAVSTGAINCVVHILNVVFSIVWPDNLIYAALSCILTKLYANTFLVALNTRKFLGGIGNSDEQTGSYKFSANIPRGLSDNRINRPLTTTNTTPTTIELKVVTETQMIVDDDELDQMRTKRSLGDHSRSMA
ncbi:hypothetical protein BD311DRAFT_762107 [Dichomitus squalens]|uniref:DUF6534 domain-containing protein n=1 Tax=Dichomitus squalens TaxID=114155 RepID=A0A4Q9MGW0_9APHY|nr:hypothetical protein BD311DRAFT_762107 [Dichomitus squalens]